MAGCVHWPRTRGELIFGGCMWTLAVACLAAAVFYVTSLHL